MASLHDQIAEEDAGSQPRSWPMALRRAGLLLFILLLGAVVVGWIQREQIARDLIGEQLNTLDLPVTYEISEISPERQILENIVIGDPDRPDLTIERLEIALVYGFGIPEIGPLTVTRPRLFGSYRSGKLSFGSLDKVVFDKSSTASGFPALDVELIDGRGLIESDYGPIGLKLDGKGRLDGGFKGEFAAIAPQIALPQCQIGRTSLYGKLELESELVSWSGPIRSSNVNCPQLSSRIGRLESQAKISLATDFSKLDADANLRASGLNLYGTNARDLSGAIELTVADKRIVSKMELTAKTIDSDQFTAGSLALDGSLRSDIDLANAEIRGNLSGQNLNPGSALDDQIEALAVSAQDTLAAPLLAKLRGALSSEVKSAQFAADFVARRSGDALSLIVPQGALTGRNGAAILTLSQFQYAQTGTATPKLSGNFRIGGTNLPKIAGRMERDTNGQSIFRLRMEEYAAGDSRIGLPEMLVNQSRSGAVAFAGRVSATGPLPGGYVSGLRVLVNGTWSQTGGLSVWRNCTQIAFDRLSFANLELNSRQVTACPARGSAIVRQSTAGLKIAAGLAQLDLAGTLAGTPIEIRSGPIGIAYPGIATAKQLNIALGPKDEASRFVISDVFAKFGNQSSNDITGEFKGADISLAAIPLDLKETAGVWSYSGDVFQIDDAEFILLDRAADKRFNNLESRGASLTLRDNVIDADAVLYPLQNDREISKVVIRHDLSSGTGFADLTVDGLKLDDTLKIDDLTPLAFGVVANVEGTVTGRGRIDWNADSITSSGEFSSDSIDLVAAFGPVKGASGTIVFTDLLNPTTAPDQTIRVASVNPGIEVLNGEVGFSLVDSQILGVTGGTWPFMGGTLELKPVELNLGVAEQRSYILVVEGVEAARFVNNLELENLLATGVFDGTLPIVFDELGNGRVVGGLLQARAPGGNVAYIGQLTYEDLSPIANFAFDTLRSLDYGTMKIEMDGPLTGDILTRVQLGQVKQGAGTKKNLITRQLADLPLQFNVNIRAPFFQLFGSMRSLYDPSVLPDPRQLGLIVDGDDAPAPNPENQQPTSASGQTRKGENN